MRPTNKVAKQGVCPDCGAVAIRHSKHIIGDDSIRFALTCNDNTCQLDFTEEYATTLSFQEGVHGTGWNIKPKKEHSLLDELITPTPTVKKGPGSMTATEVLAIHQEIESDFKKTTGLPTIDRLEAVEKQFTDEISRQCGAISITIRETENKVSLRIEAVEEYFTKELELRCAHIYETIREKVSKLDKRIDEIDRDLDSRVDSNSQRIDAIEGIPR